MKCLALYVFILFFYTKQMYVLWNAAFKCCIDEWMLTCISIVFAVLLAEISAENDTFLHHCECRRLLICPERRLWQPVTCLQTHLQQTGTYEFKLYRGEIQLLQRPARLPVYSLNAVEFNKPLFAFQVTVSTLDKRNNKLIFKVHLLEMNRKVLLDFRLSKVSFSISTLLYSVLKMNKIVAVEMYGSEEPTSCFVRKATFFLWIVTNIQSFMLLIVWVWVLFRCWCVFVFPGRRSGVQASLCKNKTEARRHHQHSEDLTPPHMNNLYRFTLLWTYGGQHVYI